MLPYKNAVAGFAFHVHRRTTRCEEQAAPSPGPDGAYLALYSGDSKGPVMRSLILWLIGIPIPIILLIWLLTGHA
jgi:hypothetical protein